jgi:hypothetical protein
MRFSRRKLVALMAAAPAIAQVASHQVTSPPVTSKIPPQGAPAPAEAPATPEARLKKASDDIHAVSERLAQIEVPMDIEPAFSFRA